MRDPVDQIWSQIRMPEARRPRRFSRGTHEILQDLYAEPAHAQWSRYEPTIRNLDAAFGADVHCGFFEELFNEKTSWGCALGIDVHTPDFDQRVNESAAKGYRRFLTTS